MVEGADHQIATLCLKAILRPVVRFCLRQAYPIQTLYQIAKIVFLEEAERELRKSTEKINLSRLSVLSGLQRKELRTLAREKTTTPPEPLGLLARVIGQWQQDLRFKTKSGEARVLTYRGEQSDFVQLVRSVTTSEHPSTVLFELERVRAIEKTSKGVRLLRRGKGFKQDPEKGFYLLSEDLDTLIKSVEENLTTDKVVPNLHLHTEYDNIFETDLPAVREWLLEQGKTFHKQAREFVAKFDKDINPGRKEEKAGARVVLTAFSHTNQADS